MTTDQRVELARKLAEEMKREWKGGASGQKFHFSRNEWEKWAQYARRTGLQKALQLAEDMAHSRSLRPEPKRAAECISKVMHKYQQTLNGLGKKELDEILSYVGRWIIWFGSPMQGVQKNEKGPSGDAGRKPRRHH